MKNKLNVKIATSDKEIRKAQRLRYKVFYGEMDAKPKNLKQILTRIDSDKYDEYCNHLIVLDKKKVVGTYRILDGITAKNIFGGFYSSNEFDIPLDNIETTLELGRACIHPKYRNKKVLELLFKGVYEFALGGGYDRLIGCVSFPSYMSTDYERGIAFLNNYAPVIDIKSKQEWLWKPELRHPFNIKDIMNKLPPLIKAYIRLGGSFSKECFSDIEFNTTDLFVEIKLNNIPEKYKTKFSKN